MNNILIIVYCIIAYWAGNQTVYRHYIMCGNPIEIFTRKAIFSITLGIILIPIAVLQLILKKEIWKGKNNKNNSDKYNGKGDRYNIDNLNDL